MYFKIILISSAVSKLLHKQKLYYNLWDDYKKSVFHFSLLINIAIAFFHVTSDNLVSNLIIFIFNWFWLHFKVKIDKSDKDKTASKIASRSSSFVYFSPLFREFNKKKLVFFFCFQKDCQWMFQSTVVDFHTCKTAVILGVVPEFSAFVCSLLLFLCVSSLWYSKQENHLLEIFSWVFQSPTLFHQEGMRHQPRPTLIFSGLFSMHQLTSIKCVF